MVERLKFYGAAAITGVLLLGFVVWMVLVGFALDDKQVLSEDGQTVLLDRYARAKEIATLLLPFVTTALGFWVGSKGVEAAKEETAAAKGQRDAYELVARDVGAAPAQPLTGQRIYDLAVEKNPAAFGKK